MISKVLIGKLAKLYTLLKPGVNSNSGATECFVCVGVVL